MNAKVRRLLIIGGVINQCALFLPIIFLSGFYMDTAAAILGEPVAWPQIGFMSAYPSDVRNGYVLFAAAVLTVVIISSGPIAGLLGASFGKTAVGLRYVDTSGRPTGFRRFMLRGLVMTAIVATILLPGPILGFVFGASIDNLSLICLFLGCVFSIWALFATSSEKPSPVNRLLGKRPVLRSHDKEK